MSVLSLDIRDGKILGMNFYLTCFTIAHNAFIPVDENHYIITIKNIEKVYAQKYVIVRISIFLMRQNN